MRTSSCASASIICEPTTAPSSGWRATSWDSPVQARSSIALGLVRISRRTLLLDGVRGLLPPGGRAVFRLALRAGGLTLARRRTQLGDLLRVQLESLLDP